MYYYCLATIPSCDKCAKVKQILETRGISYKELSIEEFRSLYQQYRDKIKRVKDNNNSQIQLPILFIFKDIELKNLDRIIQENFENIEITKDIKIEGI